MRPIHYVTLRQTVVFSIGIFMRTELDKYVRINKSLRRRSLTCTYGRVHPTALGPELFRNATGRPCSYLFHCVQSFHAWAFRNEPTTSRCDRSGTVPARVRSALWCEGTTGRVPVATRYPMCHNERQAIHLSEESLSG